MKTASPSFRLVLRVLHATGCRPGEAARMTAEAFNPEAGCVVLHEHKADKGGKPRVVFLPPEIVSLLREQAQRYPSGPLLRTAKGQPWTGRSITESMQDLKERTGVRAMAITL